MINILELGIPEWNVQDQIDRITPVRGLDSLLETCEAIKYFLSRVTTFMYKGARRETYKFLDSMIVRTVWFLNAGANRGGTSKLLAKVDMK